MEDVSVKVISDASMGAGSRTMFWVPMLPARTSSVLFPSETVSLCFPSFSPRMGLPEGGWAVTDPVHSKRLLRLGYEPNVILCSEEIVENKT